MTSGRRQQPKGSRGGGRVGMRYGFTREPSGGAYHELLEFCGSRSVVATLVIRELDWLEEDAISVMERLAFQIEVAERSECLARDWLAIPRGLHVPPRFQAPLRRMKLDDDSAGITSAHSTSRRSSSPRR